MLFATMITLNVYAFLVTILISKLGQIVHAKEFECLHGTGFFPDLHQCDLYYLCSRGNPTEKLCPDGLVFDDRDPNRERCDIPANVKCGNRTALQIPKSTPGCPHANGFYVHPSACNMFYNCVEGVPHEMSCPAGLVYDDRVSTCIWPQDNHRKNCTKPLREVLDDGFSCPDGEVVGADGQKLPHPTYPNPSDCQQFYICRYGIEPQRGSCSDGTVYNEVKATCDDPDNVPRCKKYREEVASN